MSDKARAELMLKYFRGECEIESNECNSTIWKDCKYPFWNWGICDYREKKKEQWRDKLFDGAPVILDCSIDDRYCHTKGVYSSKLMLPILRLPTVEESPRNVWLCAPNVMPEGLTGKNFILRDKANNTYREFFFDWELVTAFMILEDLK